MELATPRGIVIQEARGSTIIIDLVFISQILQQRLVECTTNMVLDYGLDYFFILLQFELYLVRAKLQLARAWKKADLELVAITTTQELFLFDELIILDQIDIYFDYLVGFIQRLVDLTVLWTKSLGYLVLWQSSEVVDIVRVDRKARYCWLDLGLVEDWTKRQKTSSLKCATIVKAQ